MYLNTNDVIFCDNTMIKTKKRTRRVWRYQGGNQKGVIRNHK